MIVGPYRNIMENLGKFATNLMDSLLGKTKDDPDPKYIVIKTTPAQSRISD
jgi:hypothetical protein